MPVVELSCITSINYDSWTEEEKSPIKLDSFVENYGIFKKLEKKQVEGNYSVQKDSKGLTLLNVNTNQIVKIVRKYRKCPHYLEDDRNVISIIALGTNAGVFVDSSNSVWSFDSTSSQSCVYAKHVFSFHEDKVVKIAPGRGHFLILLKCKGVERKRTCSFGTEKSQFNFDFCEKCKSTDDADEDLTRSMIEADQKAEKTVEIEEPTLTVDGLNEQIGQRSALTSISEDLFLDKPWDVVSYKDRSFSQSNPNELDFSFVSLDRISIWDKIDLADSSSGEFSEKFDSKEGPTEASWFEVWSYGENECGQLGHGDTVTRFDPVRIVTLVDSMVVDIVAGTNFSTALTAAGEIYVWGKHISSDGSDNILVPRLQKLGLDQFAFDVTTTVNALWILLNGPRTSVTLYRIGEIRGGYTTTRVKLQKDQLPIKICSTGAEVHMLKLLPHNRLKELLTMHFDIAQMAKMIRGVLDILGRIKNCTEDKYLAMMTDNCSSLLGLYQEFSILMQYTVQVIQDSKASKNVTDVLAKFSASKFLNRLNKAIKDCAISVASGYLHSLTFPSDTKLRIDRLATEYSEDSAQPAKVLVKLFHRIILWLKHLEVYGQELASTSRDDSVRSRLSSSFQIWQKSSAFLKRLMFLANQTQTSWKDANLMRLHKIGRFLLGSYNVGLKDEIKRITLEKPRYRLMNPKISSIYVFSDSLVLLINNDTRCYDLNLVWTEKTPEETIYVKTPDMECSLEFNEDENKEGHNWNTFCMQCRYPFDPLMEGIPYPLTRYGRHQFSNDCEREKLRLSVYEGEWRRNRMHGKGTLTFPSGDIHKGMFVDDVLHGFGEIHRAVLEEGEANSGMLSSFYLSSSLKSVKFNIFRGVFDKGVLNGIAKIRYFDERTYEGYVLNEEPFGFGLLRSSTRIHIGSFQFGLESGYGVDACAKSKTLGEFGNSKDKLNRLVVTIDGAVTEGEVLNNVFKNGRITAVMPDGDTVEFEGEMEGANIGRTGKLTLAKNRSIVGSFSGNLFNGEINVLEGTMEFSSQREDLMNNEEPKLSVWSVPLDKRWKDMFDSFKQEELGVSGGETNCGQVWSSIVWSMERGRQLLCRNAGNSDEKYPLRKGFCRALEHIPDYNSSWSLTYYENVVEYWRLALDNAYHPICRIMMSVVDVFQISYGDVAEHRALYSNATLEAVNLINRVYEIARILFPSLPSDPNHVISYDFETDHSRKSTDDVFHITSSEDSVSTSTDSSPEKTNKNETDKFRFPVPANDFVNDAFFSRCGPVLFSIFSLYNKDVNDRYWERTMYLNNFTDVKILRYLSVPKELWPWDMEEDDDLKRPMTIALAREKFYSNAVHMLQQLPMETNPSQKLRILAGTFSIMRSTVDKLLTSGKHIWTADDLLPAFTYVVVRSQIRHLGTEILLIDNFSRDFRGSGEISMMFTMLQSSYHIICNEKNRI